MNEKKEKHSLEDCIEEFLLYLDSVRGLSPNTVKAYRLDLERFKTILQKNGVPADSEISVVREDDIRACIGFLSKNKSAAASINRFLSSVKTLFAYCRKIDYIQMNPSFEIKSVKVPKRLPRFMTNSEVDKLCAQPEKNELLWSSRDCAILEMLYSSGCRVSELASLLISDLEADFSSAIVTGKGRKDRRVYFEKDAVDALKKYLDDRSQRFPSDAEDALFVNQRGKPLTTRGIAYILTRYSGNEGTKIHVSPHAFRHTFATAMLTNGADVRLVQELLGHSSISTTQRYTHINTNQLIAMYNKAHPHGGDKEK